MDNSVLFDRLAGCFQLYEINLEVLEKYTESVDNHWVHLIGGCKDINDLPNDLKEQVVKCFPRFFEEYPQYKNADCLNY